MALNRIGKDFINRTGLDSDTLDGKSSEQFALDHNHPYLPTDHPSSRFSWVNISGVGARIVVDGGGNNAAVSLADNANTWAGLKHWRGTQSQYNAIASKDPNTLYLVRKG